MQQCSEQSGHGCFDLENMERIYMGQPALIDGSLPEERLPTRQYEIASLLVDGMSYEEISSKVGLAYSTVRTHLHKAYAKLGVTSKIGLAGFFPLESDDTVLKGKYLGQLTPCSLEVIEALSRGMEYAAIGLSMNIDASTARTHLYNAKQKWPASGNALKITRIANGLRATYAQELVKNENISEAMGELALYNLVDVEPKIRSAVDLD